jgi:histidinol phosphatase-like PHP family hydrolase
MKTHLNDPAELAREYLGGLAHVHTRLSNHTGHYESDQTVTSFVQSLMKSRLAGVPDAPLRYIMINEHASNPKRPHQLGTFSLRARALLRSRWKSYIDGVPILHGFEASLMPDGSTDLTSKLEHHCEMVIGSMHWLPVEMQSDSVEIGRLLEQACHNDKIDVIGHPARNIEGLKAVRWDEIFRVAAATGTAVEVNLNTFPTLALEPERHEFWLGWLSQLEASGAPVFLGSDLHNKMQMGQFLRAWHSLGQTGAPNSLRDCILALEEVGITPDKVVNSNYEHFVIWLRLEKLQRHHVS